MSIGRVPIERALLEGGIVLIASASFSSQSCLDTIHIESGPRRVASGSSGVYSIPKLGLP
jgi:hypothetical protein